MRASTEISIDLTADDLLSPPTHSPAKAAQSPTALVDYEDTVEIELTAEEMDKLLSTGIAPDRR
jgi:hypothetical protein